MSDAHHEHGHEHGHHHREPESVLSLRVRALESLLVEKKLVASEAVDRIVSAYEEDIGPHNGAKVVARAWLDPGYKQRLLADGTTAIEELGFGGVDLKVVENRPGVHNMVVCTLCSCYPHALIGLPPVWYKSFEYRSRAVRDRLDSATAAAAPTEPRLTLGELLGHPIIIRALCGVIAAAPVFSFSQIWGAKYLVRTFGLEQGDVGNYLWLPPVLFDLGAVLFGDRASRQRRPEGAPPRGLYAIGIVLAVVLGTLPLAATPWQSMWIMGIAMGGSGALYTLITSDLLGRMPAGSVSFAGGVMACAQSMALIISSPLIGRAVDKLGDYDAIGIALAIWVIPGSLIWLLWHPPVRLEPRVPRAVARP
jgi:hypothetical protein